MMIMYSHNLAPPLRAGLFIPGGESAFRNRHQKARAMVGRGAERGKSSRTEIDPLEWRRCTYGITRRPIQSPDGPDIRLGMSGVLAPGGASGFPSGSKKSPGPAGATVQIRELS